MHHGDVGISAGCQGYPRHERAATEPSHASRFPASGAPQTTPRSPRMAKGRLSSVETFLVDGRFEPVPVKCRNHNDEYDDQQQENPDIDTVICLLLS